MRFAEKGDLLDFILKNGAVAENQARIWFRQLVLGIIYAHKNIIALIRGYQEYIKAIIFTFRLSAFTFI